MEVQHSKKKKKTSEGFYCLQDQNLNVLKTKHLKDGSRYNNHIFLLSLGYTTFMHMHYMLHRHRNNMGKRQQAQLTKRQISWGGAFKIHLTSIICTHEWKIHEAEIFFVVVVSWYFCIPGSRLVIQRVLSSSVPLLSFFYGGIWWLYGGMGKSTGLAGRPGLALCPDLPSWSLPSISVSLRGGWSSPRAAPSLGCCKDLRPMGCERAVKTLRCVVWVKALAQGVPIVA